MDSRDKTKPKINYFSKYLPVSQSLLVVTENKKLYAHIQTNPQNLANKAAKKVREMRRRPTLKTAVES